MLITKFSIITATFLFTVLTLMLYAVRKTSFFIREFGVYSISLIYIVCIVRMLVPVEFPFTKVVLAETFLNPLISVLNYPVFSVRDREVCIWTLLVAVWLGGTVILLRNFIKSYIMARMAISKLSVQDDKWIQDEMNGIQVEKRRYIPVKVLYSKHVPYPYSFGLIKKQILLPMRDYSEVELHYILLHEYTHFINHDLLLKMIIHIAKCIFWWNPACYLLEKDLDQILEMKCDVSITAEMSKEEKADYLQTILTQLRKTEENRKNVIQLPKAAASLFGDKESVNLEERFKYVASYRQERGKFVPRMAFAASVVLVIFLSYLVVFQSQFPTPSEIIATDEGVVEIEPDIVIIRKNSDGTYSMIVNDWETEITESEAQNQIEYGGAKYIEE